MTALEAKSTSDTFFIDGKNLSGTSGALFGRTAAVPPRTVFPLERLAVRLITQLSHYEELHERFEKKRVFHFEIHRGLQVRLSAPGIISEMVKRENKTVCLVELDLL
jgi:hypothetical protein